MRRTVEKSELERAARMYKRNDEAARALGITSTTFSRRCREEDIETPFNRNKRAKMGARKKKRR